MFTLRCAMLGAKALARGLGVWPVAVVGLWPVLVQLQEPAFFRTQGVPFLWPSQQALMLFLLALLPVVPRLTQGQTAAAWSDRLALRPRVLVVSTWLAGCLYGCLLLAIGCLASYSVERIMAPGGAPALDGSQVLTTALVCAGFLSATAAATPLLDHTPGPDAWVVTGWLIVVLLLIPVIGPPPLEISPSPVASPVFSGMFSAVLATCGGLSLSIALSSHRLRA